MLCLSRSQTEACSRHSAQFPTVAEQSEFLLMKVLSLHLLPFQQEHPRRVDELQLRMCAQTNGWLSSSVAHEIMLT
jgi:hypothetical protein